MTDGSDQRPPIRVLLAVGNPERERRVLIAFDSDEPGREAASDLARRLGSRARILELPEGVKDLNDLGRRPDGRATFFRLIAETERGGSESQEADEDVAEAPSA